MPGGHLYLGHRVHEDGVSIGSVREELLCNPAHPRKHLAQAVQPLFPWKVFLLCYLIHKKREDFTILRSAIGSCHTTRLDIHLPCATDAVLVGERIAGDSVAQKTAELFFRSK